MKNKIAMVTGANRGMGLALSQKLAQEDYHVIMVGRNKDQLRKESERLNSQQYTTEYFPADISDPESCHQLIGQLKNKFQRIDILVNNAGIYIDESSKVESLNFDDEDMQKTLNINTLAPFRLIKGILPLMRENGFGRIVNVSSGLGSLEGVSSHCFSYSVSKASLNIITKLFASEIKEQDIKINAVCPGWVKTDMGGPNASRSIEEGISGIFWAATLPADGPNGGFFRDGVAIPW